MTIPDFQSLMLPIALLMRDDREHTAKELAEKIGRQLHLTDEELTEMLQSGSTRVFNSRVGWAITYMYQAGLLKRPARGKCVITQRGKDVLAENPPLINNILLRRFPEFLAFQARSSSSQNSRQLQEQINREHDQTPEEILDSSYQTLRETLADDLLDRVKQASPQFFESLVIKLLVAMGYGGSLKDAGEAVGRSGDGGIDGIIKEDKLGLDAIYVQAKRWEAVVGRPVVMAFAGSLDGQRARKGVLITTSGFTQDALDYVNRIEKKIVLIDGEQLAQLMIDHGIGVTEVASYVVKRVDQDYFSEE
ncbi:MAG TPA: restriction endonuclease [Anaerolineae bacterium]